MLRTKERITLSPFRTPQPSWEGREKRREGKAKGCGRGGEREGGAGGEGEERSIFPIECKCCDRAPTGWENDLTFWSGY